MSNRRKLLRPGPYRRRVKIEESAATPALSPPETSEDTNLLPARASVTEASIGAKASAPGRMLVRLIKAGISMNGNAYPPSVLREAAKNRRWSKGCPTFVDHASQAEEEAQPAGSIKNLAGVLAEDARWDEASQSLVAEVRLFHPWRETLTDMAESIGMSIRAWVTGEHAEYEGERAFVVQSIESGRSVDFVTVPAAGGAILSVLEAVGNKVPTTEARNVAHWMESRIHADFTSRADDMFGDGRLTRDERIALSSAIGDALAAFSTRLEQDAPHLLDRDIWDEPELPVIAAASEAVATVSDPQHEDGDPAVPEPESDVTDGTPPAAPNPPTEEEPAMSGTETGAPPVQAGTAEAADTPVTTPQSTQEAPQADVITAAVQQALAAALAPMQQQLAEATARAQRQDAENRTLRNTNQAREAVTAALRAPAHADVAAHIGARVTSRVLSAIPTTADGSVDVTALGEAISAAIDDEARYVRGLRAEALESAGVGQPYGLGSADPEPVDDGFEKELESFFADTLGMTSEQASLAAKGRV